VRPKEGATCEIKRLYLRADLRGAGLGQALYEHAERFARAAGYARIWLDSSRRFARAHRLYRRNGFVLVESLDNDWEDDVYEKTLAPS
jgi:GNAT superfamily N-acetyltransferase